jgi:GNAT superfamily N-acetyltransferase
MKRDMTAKIRRFRSRDEFNDGEKLWIECHGQSSMISGRDGLVSSNGWTLDKCLALVANGALVEVAADKERSQASLADAPASDDWGSRFQARIVFRQVDEGYLDPGVHWQVEYIEVFPVGTAYLVSPREGVAKLSFILVADAWRRHGIAGKLIEACKQRWPNLTYTPPMSKEGESLLRSRTDYFQAAR